MTAPTPTTARTGHRALTAVLAVGVWLCLTASLLIAAGVVVLAGRLFTEPDIPTEAFEGTGYTTVIPSGWTELEAENSFVYLYEVQLQSPDEADNLTIVRVDVPDWSAEVICEQLVESAQEQGLATESAGRVGEVGIDGITAEHYSWSGYDGEDWHQADVLCMNDEEGPMFVLAEHDGADEAEPLPVLEKVVEEWTWT